MNSTAPFCLFLTQHSICDLFYFILFVKGLYWVSQKCSERGLHFFIKLGNVKNFPESVA